MKNKISIFYLSRQNLRRRLFRSLVTVIAIAIVTATLFPMTILGESVSASLSQGTARLGADLMVVPPGYTKKLAASLIAGEPSTFVMDSPVESEVAQIEGVRQVSPQLYFATLANG